MIDYFVEYFPLFARGAVETLKIAAMALLMAMVGGSVIAALALSKLRVLRWVATAYIGLIRGTPLIAQIFVLYFGMTSIVKLPAFWAGSIALALHNSAYIAEIIRSGFNSVPKGLVEASRSLGMSRGKTLRRIQAPLALRTTLPVLGNQFIIAVKDSSLIGFIGLTELFKTAQNAAAETYDPLAMYLIVSVYYLVIVLVLTLLVHLLERRLGRHTQAVK